jgi:hypothetical protein
LGFATRDACGGQYDRERSRGGASSWDEAPGWEVLRWHGVLGVSSSGERLPLVKISCLVTLRTDMSCGPGLRKPYIPILSNGYEADVRLSSVVSLLLGG